MKFLEIIELRSVNYNNNKLESMLKSIIDELNQDSLHTKIKLYCHISVNTDFSIHIHHDAETADINNNPLSIQVISILKGFGMINHTKWIEKYHYQNKEIIDE